MAQDRNPKRLITHARLRRERLGGVSAMWTWRRLANDPTFPKPIKLGRRLFWDEAAIDSWIEIQAGSR